MLRSLLTVITIAFVLAFTPQALSAPLYNKDKPPKRHVARHWHGYGFLPGYRPSRSNRTRARGALLPGVRAATLRSGVAGLLSRALEWRRFWTMLDTDTD